MTTCKNCENSFEGKYCPNCSQKADTHRFTIKHFAHEFFHAFTHADKGIFFLMKELVLKPGKVARDFNAGKRKRYFNPITYMLLVMALQIFITKKTEIFNGYMDKMEDMVQESQQAHPEVNPWNSDKMIKAQKANNAKVLEHNRIMNLIFLPFLSLLTWLFFRKSGFNYAENLVFNVLCIAQLLLFFIPICIAFIFIPSYIGILMTIYGFIYLAYTYLALQQFFKQRWWLTALKATAILVIYLSFIQLISVGVIEYL